MILQEFRLEEKTINEYLHDTKLSIGELRFDHYVEMAQRESDLKSFFSDAVENTNSKICRVEVPPGQGPSPLGLIVETTPNTNTPNDKTSMKMSPPFNNNQNPMMTSRTAQKPNYSWQDTSLGLTSPNSIPPPGSTVTMMMSGTPVTASNNNNTTSSMQPLGSNRIPIQQETLMKARFQNPTSQVTSGISTSSMQAIDMNVNNPKSLMSIDRSAAPSFGYDNRAANYAVRHSSTKGRKRPTPNVRNLRHFGSNMPNMTSSGPEFTSYPNFDPKIQYPPAGLRPNSTSFYQGTSGPPMFLPTTGNQQFMNSRSSLPMRTMQSTQMPYPTYRPPAGLNPVPNVTTQMRAQNMTRPEFHRQAGMLPQPRPMNSLTYPESLSGYGVGLPSSPYTSTGKPIAYKSNQYDYERTLFLQQYMRRQPNSSTNRQLGYLNFDLFDLYLLVRERGGYHAVQRGGLWKEIYAGLGGDLAKIKFLPKLVKLYEENLLDIELNRAPRTPGQLKPSLDVPRPPSDIARPNIAMNETTETSKTLSVEKQFATRPKFESIRLERIGGIDLHATRNLVDIRQKIISDPFGVPGFIPHLPISHAITINALNMLCARENIDLRRYPILLAEVSDGFLSLCNLDCAFNSEEDPFELFVDPSERPIILEKAIAFANILRSLSCVTENQGIMASHRQLMNTLVKVLGLKLECERKEDLLNHIWVMLSNIAYFVELSNIDDGHMLISTLVKTSSSEQINRRKMALECLSKMTFVVQNQNLIMDMNLKDIEDFLDSVLVILTTQKEVELEINFVLITICNFLESGDPRIFRLFSARKFLLNRLKVMIGQSNTTYLKPELLERIRASLSLLSSSMALFPLGEIEPEFDRLFRDESVSSFLKRTLV